MPFCVARPWHEWSKWEPKSQEGTTYPLGKEPGVVVTKVWQERRCKRCGFVEQSILRRPGPDQADVGW